MPRRQWMLSVWLVVGLLLVGWLLHTPPGLLGKADAVGYAFCHRIDLRSFHLGERPLPLCARCSGMYLGALLTVAYQAVLAPRRGGEPKGFFIGLMGFFALMFVVDGVNSFLSFFPGLSLLYMPQNWTRLVSGTGMGITMGMILYPVFNQTVWRDWEAESPLRSWRHLTGLLVLAAVLDLCLLSENPLILYPLALLSVMGVLLILTMVYTLVWLMVCRSENRFERPAQLLLPLSGGFGTSMLQVVLMDMGRYLLTNTWQGFSITFG
ncbi:MAG: DUF2085 domain-containing protein [Chloroflexota bacterium]